MFVFKFSSDEKVDIFWLFRVIVLTSPTVSLVPINYCPHDANQLCLQSIYANLQPYLDI